MEAFEILIIILSVVLSVFLFVGILVLAKVYTIVKTFKGVADNVEHASHSAATFAEDMRSNAKKASFAKGAASVFKRVRDEVQK